MTVRELAWHVKTDQLITGLRMLRADLKARVIFEECNKIAVFDLGTVQGIIRYCSNKAKKGEPMPWEVIK